MRLWLIRHGQSMNNIIQEKLNPLFQRGEISAEQYNEIWLAERQDDPALSPKGIAEAAKLGAFLAEWIKGQDGCRFKLYCSAMLRACQTIHPLSVATNSLVEIRPDIFETGGIYSSNGGANPQRVPGKTSTAAQLKSQFPDYDISALPQNGPWYSSGWETREMAVARAARVADWLCSPTLHSSVGTDVAAMVMHADFLNLLLQQLLHTTHDVMFPNTSTALLDIDSSGHVMIHHCK